MSKSLKVVAAADAPDMDAVIESACRIRVLARLIEYAGHNDTLLDNDDFFHLGWLIGEEASKVLAVVDR